MTIYILAAIAVLAAIAYFKTRPKPFAKSTVDLGDAKPASAVFLPVEPYGLALFAAQDTSADSNKLLDEVASVWIELWPKMRAYLDTEMKDYGVDSVLGRDKFMGSLGRMTPEVFMGDQSDIMIRLEFNDPPLWDFFIRGSTIVESQPVF